MFCVVFWFISDCARTALEPSFRPKFCSWLTPVDGVDILGDRSGADVVNNANVLDDAITSQSPCCCCWRCWWRRGPCDITAARSRRSLARTLPQNWLKISHTARAVSGGYSRLRRRIAVGALAVPLFTYHGTFAPPSAGHAAKLNLYQLTMHVNGEMVQLQWTSLSTSKAKLYKVK